MQKVGEPIEVYVSEMAYGLVLKKCCSFLEIWTSLSVKCTAVLSFKWRNASLFPDCVLHASNSKETLCWLAYDCLMFCTVQCATFSVSLYKLKRSLRSRLDTPLWLCHTSLPSLIPRLSVQDAQPQTGGLTDGLGMRL